MIWSTLQLKPPIFASKTDKGVRDKPNDDAFDHFIGQTSDQKTVYFMVVADGVTSAAGGAQASQITITHIRQQLELLNEQPLLAQMEAAVQSAHKSILETARNNPEWSNMSTTVVLAAIDGNQLYVAHMGDSRAYLIRNKSVHLLTNDHTWVQEAVDKGRLSRKEAKTHPNRHVIRKFLGIQEHIVVDHDMINPDGYHTQSFYPQKVDSIAIQNGDAILLCTDGLTDKVQDTEIGHLVHTSGNQIQRAVDNLIDLALQRKEGDNITAVLMKLPRTQFFSQFQPSLIAAIASLLLIVIIAASTARGVSFIRADTTKRAPEISQNSLFDSSTSLNSFAASQDIISGTLRNVQPPQVRIESNAPTEATLRKPLATLVEPLTDTLNGIQTFRWQTSVKPRANQAFEVVIWEEGQNPLQAGISFRSNGSDHWLEVDLDSTIAMHLVPNPRKRYRWSVLLVDVVPYKRLEQLSGDHQFRLQ
ncbi:protein phosphatase 2C domain-containing protein [Chloroflexi bacterium TSY]|nr:protein phosphatase 2C domain-containing protein [Chloroflexi bacterium TSY]